MGVILDVNHLVMVYALMSALDGVGLLVNLAAVINVVVVVILHVIQLVLDIVNLLVLVVVLMAVN